MIEVTMLVSLRLENFALFADTEIEFDPRFSALTGESGAGKSLLVRALGLVLGGPADSALARPGQDAYIEAQFEAPVPECLAELIDDGDPLVLARRIRSEGPSRAFVSGRSVSASLLAQAGAELLTIIGQHSSREMLTAAKQLDLVDAGHRPAVTVVAERYREMSAARDRVKELQEQLAEADRTADYLRADLEAWQAVEPAPGEDRDLEARIQVLDHSQEAIEALNKLALAISGEGQALDLLAPDPVIERIDPDLALEINEQIETLRELGITVRDKAAAIDTDPGALSELSERLAAINELKRRFRGQEIVQIAERIAAAEETLKTADDGEALLAEAQEAQAAAEQRYEQEAAKLSKKRSKAGRELAAAIAANFDSLELKAEIEIEVSPASPSPSGSDRVEFRFDTGLGMAPLDQGASGGELSRINLAILLATGSSGSFLFDEVDTGISGQAAKAVGQCLSELADSAQVISITHLAPIAARADRNLLVQRSDTEAEVLTLGAESRQEEIARLVGAAGDDRQTATELIEKGLG
jgi:DNA repair protein RecN (Recombination protein N)